jgi:peptidoglycan hydrolase-like protein with peptidoglycan-binding domain
MMTDVETREPEVESLKPEATVMATTTVILPEAKLGDHGSAVRLLQRILIANCFLNNSNFNATFDQATKQAVRNFQANYGLTVDGIVGPQSWFQLTNNIYGQCLPFS